MSPFNSHLQIIVLFAAAALLASNRGTADHVKPSATPGQSSLTGALFDDHIVADNVTAVRQRMLTLSEAEKYEFLAD